MKKNVPIILILMIISALFASACTTMVGEITFEDASAGDEIIDDYEADLGVVFDSDECIDGTTQVTTVVNKDSNNTLGPCGPYSSILASNKVGNKLIVDLPDDILKVTFKVMNNINPVNIKIYDNTGTLIQELDKPLSPLTPEVSVTDLNGIGSIEMDGGWIVPPTPPYVPGQPNPYFIDDLALFR